MPNQDIGINIRAKDQATQVLGRVGGGLESLTQNGVAMGAAFAGVNLAITAAMQQLQQLNQYIHNSINSFYKFEKSMAEVQTMLSSMEKDMIPNMTHQIENLSMAFGVDAVDASRALYQALSAGVDAGKAMSFLGQNAKLATAGLTSLEAATDVTTTVLNAYGMSANRVAEINDILMKTVEEGKLRLEDLTGTLGYVVPIAAQAGISFEEVSAAMASLTKQGINAHIASRSLRQTITNLISPSSESKQMMEQLGIAFDDLTLDARGLSGVLDIINEKVNGNMNQLNQLIPNVRALSAVMGLSGSQSELFNNTLNEISNSAGTVNEKLMDVTSTQEFQSRVRDQFINKLDREIGKEMQWIDATEKMNEIYQKSGGWMGKLPIPALQAVGSLQGMNKIQELLNSSSETYNSFVDETKQELETQYVTDFAGELERLSDIGSSNALLMERLRARIGEYKQDVIDLTRQLDKLNSTQSMKESLRYIPLALKATGDELQKYGYLNKIADEQTRSLVDSIRLQKQELDDLQQVNESYSRSMQTNNIRLMEIELKSMKHRGRLTRNQKEEMNELKQENLEYRISQAKNQQEINSIKQGELREDENVLASKQRMLKEEIYLINDNYNEQVNTLQRSINYRKLLINEHTTDMQTAQQQSLDAWQTYYDNVLLATQDWSEDMKNEFKKVAGYTLASGSSSAINAISSIKYGSSPGTGSSLGDALSSGNLKDLFVGDYAVGTSYVPRDGLAMVHRGETINRNNDASGDRNININFNGNIRVEDGRTDDITSLTQKVSQAVRAGLMSGASTVYD